MGREIKFKPATFYLGITDHLARVVEGRERPAEEAVSSGAQAGVSDAERKELEQIRQEGERVEMAESLGKGEEDSGSRPGSSGPRTNGSEVGK